MIKPLHVYEIISQTHNNNSEAHDIIFPNFNVHEPSLIRGSHE